MRSKPTAHLLSGCLLCLDASHQRFYWSQIPEYLSTSQTPRFVGFGQSTIQVTTRLSRFASCARASDKKISPRPRGPRQPDLSDLQRSDLIELVFGALLVIGLFTRFSAFIASGLTAVAYFYAHAGRNFFPILNGGELAALYSFVFLYLAAVMPANPLML